MATEWILHYEKSNACWNALYEVEHGEKNISFVLPMHRLNLFYLTSYALAGWFNRICLPCRNKWRRYKMWGASLKWTGFFLLSHCLILLDKKNFLFLTSSRHNFEGARWSYVPACTRKIVGRIDSSPPPCFVGD